MHGQLPHRRREATNLVGRFTLGAQARQQGAGERRRQLAPGKLVHEIPGLAFCQCVAVQQTIKQPAVLPAHDISCRMKLAMSMLPSGVRTLSG